MDFGGGPLPRPVESAAFIATFSPGGEHLWSASLSAMSIRVAAIVATEDAVYAGGTFRGRLEFNGDTAIVSEGLSDGFVASWSGDGELRWVRHVSGSDVEQVHGLALLGSNIVVSGSFSGTLLFETPAVPTTGGVDMFVALLDAEGSFRWQRVFGGAGSDVFFDVAVRADDSIVGVGVGGDGWTADGHAFVSAGAGDAVLIGLMSAGGVTTLSAFGSPGYDGIGRVVRSLGGFVAWFDSEGPLRLGSLELPRASVAQSVVVGLGSDGRTVRWATRSNSQPRLGDGHGVVAVGDGLHAGLVGPWLGRTTGGPLGSVDAVIGLLSDDGELVWSRRIGGPGFDRIHAVEPTERGGVYAIVATDGRFEDGDTRLEAIGTFDYVLARYDP